MNEMHEQAAAIKRICTDLGLPEGDAFTQDWAYELGEEFRGECHLYEYLSAYDNPGYHNRERHVLIQLILDIVNDLLQKDHSAGRKAWDETVKVIGERLSMHREQIEYWAVVGESLENAFALTPLARELLMNPNSNPG